MPGLSFCAVRRRPFDKSFNRVYPPVQIVTRSKLLRALVASLVLLEGAAPVVDAGPPWVPVDPCNPIAMIGLNNISPAGGPASGGTTVVLTGICFGGAQGVSGVQFGGVSAPSFTVNSDTQITVVTPPHAAGAVDVVVQAIPPGIGGCCLRFTYDPCAIAGLAPDVPAPQPAGATITFTATSTVCTAPEYLFYTQAPGRGWVISQGYGSPTFTWHTAGLGAGSYNVDVWVRQLGSRVAYQAFHLIPYMLSPPLPCSSAGLSSDLPSPQQVDFKVTFTGTSSGCVSPQYLFYVQLPSGVWQLARGWGGPTFVWDTSKLASVGSYNVNVWVRRVGFGTVVEANRIMPFTITNRVCSAAGLISDKTSPQAHGAVITFTASSAGCAKPDYLFFLKSPGLNGTWSPVHGYGGDTWVWNTAGVASVGTYEVNVWVRAAGSGVPVQTNAVVYYTLT